MQNDFCIDVPGGAATVGLPVQLFACTGPSPSAGLSASEFATAKAWTESPDSLAAGAAEQVTARRQCRPSCLDNIETSSIGELL